MVYPDDVDAQILVLSALGDTLTNTLTNNIADESVTVVEVIITSVGGVPVSVDVMTDLGRNLAHRHLAEGEILYEAVLQAVTIVVTAITDGNIVSASVNGNEQPIDSIAGGSSASVVDALAGTDAIGDLLLTSVTQAMDNAIAPSSNGENSFLATFQEVATAAAAASGDAGLSEMLSEVVENIAVVSVATDQTQDIQAEQQVSDPVMEIVEVLTSLLNPDWYPGKLIRDNMR